MPDVFQDFPIKAPARRVFEAVSTPAGLDAWWTKCASGRPEEHEEYKLGFGPGFEWRAKASRCAPDAEFELELIEADGDWQGTRLGFCLRRITVLLKCAFTTQAGPLRTSIIVYPAIVGRCTSGF
jgi:uncharacterized protein YndB with AHSA1/START domain